MAWLLILSGIAVTIWGYQNMPTMIEEAKYAAQYTHDSGQEILLLFGIYGTGISCIVMGLYMFYNEIQS